MKGMGVDVFIDLRNTAYTITADVEVDANANGVIVCQGGRFGGLAFYVKNGKPAFTYNYLGMESTDIMASQPLKPGKYKIVYDFKYDGGGLGKGGVGTITVNGKGGCRKGSNTHNRESSQLMTWLILVLMKVPMWQITGHHPNLPGDQLCDCRQEKIDKS